MRSFCRRGNCGSARCGTLPGESQTKMMGLLLTLKSTLSQWVEVEEGVGWINGNEKNIIKNNVKK